MCQSTVGLVLPHFAVTRPVPLGELRAGTPRQTPPSEISLLRPPAPAMVHACCLSFFWHLYSRTLTPALPSVPCTVRQTSGYWLCLIVPSCSNIQVWPLVPLHVNRSTLLPS